MIVGVGVDVVSVERIRGMLSRHGERFIRRTFTAAEAAYCGEQKHDAEHFAARFAAKEAVAKALGTGIARGVGWKDIEVVRRPSGRPGVRLLGDAVALAERLGVGEIHVSLSHSRTDAIAFVVAESR